MSPRWDELKWDEQPEVELDFSHLGPYPFFIKEERTTTRTVWEVRDRDGVRLSFHYSPKAAAARVATLLTVRVST